jgi:hypothetical protein
MCAKRSSFYAYRHQSISVKSFLKINFYWTVKALKNRIGGTLCLLILEKEYFGVPILIFGRQQATNSIMMTAKKYYNDVR